MHRKCANGPKNKRFLKGAESNVTNSVHIHYIIIHSYLINLMYYTLYM